MAKIKEMFNKIVKKMIKEMEQSNGEWIDRWSSPNGLPQNYVTKRYYRGFNSIHLSMIAFNKGYEIPYWLTFHQVKTLGGRVKKGEKAVDVFFYKFIDKEIEVKNEENEEKDIKDIKLIKIPLLRNYKVFNIQQTEGIELPKIEEKDNPSYQNVENFIQQIGTDIKYGGYRAFYDPVKDFIKIPEIKHFVNSDAYYATLFHEMIHWTGHETRLNRKLPQKWGDKIYSFEELIAELGAVFLCNYFNVNIEKNRHPEYLKSWVEALEEDPRILWKVSSKAQEAFDFLINLNEKNKKNNTNQTLCKTA